MCVIGIPHLAVGPIGLLDISRPFCGLEKFNHLPVKGQVEDCFWVLAITNKVAVNIGGFVCIMSFQDIFFPQRGARMGAGGTWR